MPKRSPFALAFHPLRCLSLNNIPIITRFGLIWLVCILQFGFSQYPSSGAHSHSVVFKGGKISAGEDDFILSSSNDSRDAQNQTLIPLEIFADFEMAYIWIYDEEGSGNDTLILPEDTSATILLPEGIYTLFTGYCPDDHHHVLIAEDSLSLNSPLQIHLSEEEAVRNMLFDLVKETGTSMGLSVISFRFYSKINDVQFRLSHSNGGFNTFTLKHDSLPPQFDMEWVAVGKPLHNNGGNVYLVSGELREALQDTVIRNDPADLVHADFYYHFADSMHSGHFFQISTLFPDFYSEDTGGDPIYTYPVHLRVYQDTTLGVDYRSSTFIQFVTSNSFFHISTQEVRIEADKVIGFFLSDRDAGSYTISERPDRVHLGLPPAYWFGKFFNKPDTIKIRSSHGRFEHLFLYQGNDIPLHYDVDYELLQNGTAIKQGKFPYAAGGPIMFLGFDPDSLTMPVSPGSYEIVITDNHYELAGQAGILRVTAGFDLTVADRNPPNIIHFQILAGDETVEVVDPNETAHVRFIVEDENSLDSLGLFHSNWGDTIWNEISLNYSEPYWEGVIPQLSIGFYSLRLIARDQSGNYIDCIMAPGFLVDESMALSDKNLNNRATGFHLYQNHPNPFNPVTTIAYALPFAAQVELTVFDLLGRHVRTLVNARQPAGNYEVQFDGDYLGSGVYLYRLKVDGEAVITRKMVLLR